MPPRGTETGDGARPMGNGRVHRVRSPARSLPCSSTYTHGAVSLSASKRVPRWCGEIGNTVLGEQPQPRPARWNRCISSRVGERQKGPFPRFGLISSLMIQVEKPPEPLITGHIAAACKGAPESRTPAHRDLARTEASCPDGLPHSCLPDPSSQPHQAFFISFLNRLVSIT